MFLVAKKHLKKGPTNSGRVEVFVVRFVWPGENDANPHRSKNGPGWMPSEGGGGMGSFSCFD